MNDQDVPVMRTADAREINRLLIEHFRTREGLIDEAGRLIDKLSPLEAFQDQPYGPVGQAIRRRFMMLSRPGDPLHETKCEYGDFDEEVVARVMLHFGIPAGFVPPAPLLRQAMALYKAAEAYASVAGLGMPQVMARLRKLHMAMAVGKAGLTAEEILALPYEEVAALVAEDEVPVPAQDPDLDRTPFP